MNSVSAYINLGNERLHYLQYGNGKKLLVAFHGFGGDAAMFAPLAQYIGEQYTLLSIDLPHHGKTMWREGSKMLQEDLITLVHLLIKQYHVNTLSLLGYSMGGRVCLKIAELMPECIDRMTLVASDGLSTNIYYYLLTRTTLGKIFFEHTLRYPARYIKILTLLRNVKLINRLLYRFLMQTLNTAEKREQVKVVWQCMCYLQPHRSNLKKEINKYRIPVTIFMGRYDKIIPAASARRFKEGLETVNLITIKKGHHLPQESNMQVIAESLI